MKPHLAIGIHSVGSILDEAVFNVLPMLMHSMKSLGDAHASFIGVSRSKVAAARNKIVTDALEIGCTHWLSLDTDHMFPIDFVERIWASRGDDVGMVSGLIHKRAFPFHQVAFKFFPETKKYELASVPMDSGLVEVDACAFGCTLVNIARIYDLGLKGPWFKDNGEGRSDMNFCRSVKDLGLKILVDTGLPVGHLMDPVALWPKDVETLRASYIGEIARG